MCQTRVRNRGKDHEHIEYYHRALAVSGYRHALPLRPEFITPQDGDKKQDCGTKAACRWLDNSAQRYASLKPIYLGDDLYAKRPMCRKMLEHGADFILRVKTDDHTTLFDYLHGLKCPTKKQLEKTSVWGNPNRIHTFHMERTPVATDGRQVAATGLLHRTKNTSGRTQKTRRASPA